LDIRFAKVLIIEPDLSGSEERGHVRQGVRYLEEILDEYFPEAEGEIYISGSNSFQTTLRKFKPFEISPSSLMEFSPINFRRRLASEILHTKLGAITSRSRVARLITSENLWNTILASTQMESDKNQLIVLQNLEHIFLPSLKLPSNVFLALRFISKPSKKNEKDFLFAIKELCRKNPGRVHIAFENIKTRIWFENNSESISSFHVPWFGLVRNDGKSQTQEKKEVIIFPGGQRKEKGIMDIPGIIRGINSRSNRIYEFKLQYSRDFPEVFKRLEIENNVNVLPEFIPHSDYLSEILYAKIGILPYEESNYLWTGSGVMADCIASGTYLVAPAQTAIGYEIEKFSLGQTYVVADEVSKLIEEVSLETYGLARSYYLEHSKSELKNWLAFTVN
jgi:hypothetical protein